MTARKDKVGVIDVGSNSVRSAVFSFGRLTAKRLITSRLGEGVFNGLLSAAAISRSVDAVCELADFCKQNGAEAVYVFATEAVRRAKNAEEFTALVENRLGVRVDVVSPQTEAELALGGALQGEDGCVIDLGGASTEIVVRAHGAIVYAKSLPVGAVVLNDVCGRDKTQLTAYITQKCADYGVVPRSNRIVAVGGTATSLAACKLKIKSYDSNKVHGTTLTVADLDCLIEELENTSPERIAECYPVDGRRAEIILGGAIMLKHALLSAGGESLTVSESDNLEGYYRRLFGRESYER